MQHKQLEFKPVGMQKDLSESLYSNQSIFHGHNIRFNSEDTGGLMTITNEKGTTNLNLEVKGIIIGSYVLGEVCTIFSTWEDYTEDFKGPDFIYKLYVEEEDFILDILYNGNLSFSKESTLDITGYYENSKVQNIYWVDGINVPRVINVQEIDSVKEEWGNTSFDFSKDSLSAPALSVSRIEDAGGQFPPGTTQYVAQLADNSGTITSQAFYVSDIYYNTATVAASNPNVTSSQGYKITIENSVISTNTLIIYSIITTENNAIEIKKLSTLSLTSLTITLTDTNTLGTTVDSTDLVFENLASFVAGTLCQKDNYLFLGNLKSLSMGTEASTFIKTELLNTTIDYYKYTTNKSSWNYNLDTLEMSTQKTQLTLDLVHDLQNNVDLNILDYSLDNVTINTSNNTVTTVVITDSYNTDTVLKIKAIGPNTYFTRDDGVHQDDPFITIDIAANFSGTKTINSTLPNTLSTWYNNSNDCKLNYFLYHEEGYNQFPTDSISNINTTISNNVLTISGTLNTGLAWNDYVKFSTYVNINNIWTLFQEDICYEDAYSLLTYNSTLLDGISENTLVKFVILVQSSNQISANKYSVVTAGKFYNSNSNIENSFKKILHQKTDARYSYNNQLIDTASNIKNFKQGETYRLGIQFWHSSGYYSNVFYLTDHVFEEKPITYILNTSEDTSNSNNYIYFKYPILNLDKNSALVEYLLDQGYTHARPLVVYPSDVDRTIIAQGILTPTITKNDGTTALSNNYVAQASWIARSNGSAKITSTDTSTSISYFSSISPSTESPTGTTINAGYGIACRHGLNTAIGLSLPFNFIVGSDTVAYDYSFGWTNNDYYDTSIWKTYIGEDNLYEEPRPGTYFHRYFDDDSSGHSINCNYVAFHSPSIYTDNTIIINRLSSPITLKIVGIAPQTSFDYNRSFSGISEIRDDSNNYINFDSSKASLNFNPYCGTSFYYSLSDERLMFHLFGNGSYIGKYEYHEQYEGTFTKLNCYNFRHCFNNIFFNSFKELTYDNLSFASSSSETDIILNNSERYIAHPSYGSHVHTLPTLVPSSSEDIYVPIQYKSTDHIIIKLDENILLPIHKPKTFSYEDPIYGNNILDLDYLIEQGYFWIAEIHQEVENKFGGTSEDAFQNNIWNVCGNLTSLTTDNDYINIEFLQGDTYYQRYDCLYTTFEDGNENLVDMNDIISFMCETPRNLDSRYDDNRFQNQDYLSIQEGINFNLFNTAYNYDTGYFSYAYVSLDEYDEDIYPTSIILSEEKILGDETDAWTNIKLISPLTLDGDKGDITALKVLNNDIYCFQESGVSNILFNDRAQISTEDNIPIEITNATKLQGKRYISNTIGCNNRESIVVTPSGIYFIDNSNNSLYLLNGSNITNLSVDKGLSSWFKTHSFTKGFNPSLFDNYKLYYDVLDYDLYISTNDTCLVYNETLGQFTSFMDYDNLLAIFNINNKLLSIKDSNIWTHKTGDYNMFYGTFKPFSITYLMSPEGSKDVLFNNLEFMSDTFTEDGTIINSTFDNLTVTNEYQSGTCDLKFSTNVPSNLKRKFRLWRINIPRDSSNHRDRIRNPWIYTKLSKMTEDTNKFKLHNMVLKYFV